MSNTKRNESPSPSPAYKHVAVEGMSCSACATGVKRILEKQAGIQSAEIQLANHTARIGYHPDIVDWLVVDQKLQSAGYGLVHAPSDAESSAAEILRSELKKTSQQTLIAAVLGAPLIAVGMIWMHTEWARWLMPLLATPIMLIPGRRFFEKALKQIRTATWGMDSLVALSCTTAYVYSLWNTMFPVRQPEMGLRSHVYYEGIGAIIGFLLFGRWLEGRARLKATLGIGNLLNEQPTVALCWRNNAWTGVSVASLHVDDRVLIQAGGCVPVDGCVVDGGAEVDESWLSGEPFPVSRGIGDEVRAGSQTISGRMEVVVTRKGTETLLAQIHQQIRDAQAARAPIQDLVDQITRWFVPGVLALAFLSATVWWIVAEENAFSMGVLAFVNTLIVACPCALGLATPTALVAGVSSAARLGVLVRDAAVWENAAKINVLLCDKTGTLTVGRPVVRSVRWCPSTSSDQRHDLLELWQKSAQYSTHLVARSLIPYVDSGENRINETHKGERTTTQVLDISQVEEHVGLGVSFQVGGTMYRSGRRSFVEDKSPDTRQHRSSSPKPDIGTEGDASFRWCTSDANSSAYTQKNPPEAYSINDTQKNPPEAYSSACTHQKIDDWGDWIQNQPPATAELYFGSNGNLLACALVDDPLRSDALDFVAGMKKRGIELTIVSGDSLSRVASIAQEIGIKNFKGDLLPSDKLTEVRFWQSKNKLVAMLGDGLNDAGALAAADLGMAMGAGSALSKHQSGLVVVRDDLTAISRFFNLARHTRLILRQNLIWAFAYNVIGIPIAMGVLYPFFGILLHPSHAAAAMALSSVSVVVNSVRLLKLKF